MCKSSKFTALQVIVDIQLMYSMYTCISVHVCLAINISGYILHVHNILQLSYMYVIVIARDQGFMAVNRPESEGAARGQGRFTLP